MDSKSDDCVVSLNSIGMDDVARVGGKNASLGEMIQHLAASGVNVPGGFATTACAFRRFLSEAGLTKRISAELEDLDAEDVKALARTGRSIRKMIIDTPIEGELRDAIAHAFEQLESEAGGSLAVAVRSSATAEDLPDASFAGQQETFLNVYGNEKLLVAVKKCIASLFTNRAISYRVDKKFDHFSIALSVGVQKMVRSDLSVSGVLFTLDTESGFRNAVLINSIFGLGENIVLGAVTPDEFYVFKPTKAIISRSLSKKNMKMIYNLHGPK